MPCSVHSQVPRQEQQGKPLSGGGLPPRQLDQDEVMSWGEEDAQGVENQPPVANVSLISSHHLMNASGLSPHKVQVMKASLFQDGEEEPRVASDRAVLRSPLLSRHQQGVQSPPPPNPPPRTHAAMTRGSFRATAAPLQGSGLLKSTSHLHLLHQSPLPTQHYSPSSSVGSPSDKSKRPDAVAYMHPVQSSLSLTKQKSVVLVPATSSMVVSKAGAVADLGLFLGRSFRCGWGSNWTLAHCGTPLSQLNPGEAPFGDQAGPFSQSFIPERKCEPLTVKVERLQVRPEGEDCLVREGG